MPTWRVYNDKNIKDQIYESNMKLQQMKRIKNANFY